MYNPDKHQIKPRFGSLNRIAGILAVSSVIISGCSTSPKPSHEVTVQPGQTLDDIGQAECGPSLLGLTVVPRRNHIKDFNDLDGYRVTAGQVLSIPDSLCYDTGDKVRDTE